MNPDYSKIIEICLIMNKAFEDKNYQLWSDCHSELFEKTNFYHKGVFKSDKLLRKFADMIESQCPIVVKELFPDKFKYFKGVSVTEALKK